MMTPNRLSWPRSSDAEADGEVFVEAIV